MSEIKKFYPRHDVNPKEKGGDAWLLQYARAAYNDAETNVDKMFFRAATNIQELRDIAHGKASVDKYKPLLGLEEGADESHLAVDWSNRPIVSKLRDIGLSKIRQRQFRITATPIDALGKTELDKFYHGMRAKLVAIKQAQELGAQGLLQAPELQIAPGEPEDMEALEMKMKYSPKINVAIEAEKGVRMVFYQNDIELHREKVDADLWDIGHGGYKEWLDENGMVRVRAIEPSNFLISFCRQRDFSDAVHMGEVIEVPLVEISKYFTAAQMEIICNSYKGRMGNPMWIGDNTAYNQGFDGFKCQVLDLEILSDDTIVYEKRVDKRGNLHVNKGKFDKRYSDAKVVIDGKEVNKFTPRTITNIYKVKWVIGTDLVYDCGLAHNMKREPSKKLMGRTTFSYHLFAMNFDNMRCQSMMERLRPLYDDYMTTHFKLQNLKNSLISNGWAIDLDALESVSLQKGGEDMAPDDVLEMFFQKGILVYRGSQLDNTNPNRKPVESISASQAAEIVSLRNELVAISQEMNYMIGLNEVTDSSSPSDRMLNGVAAMANQATNNALFPIMAADKHLLVRAAKGVVQRLQIAVKNGDIEGIIKGLGSTTVEHIKVTNAIAPHIWGIMIDDIPTDEERMQFLQQLNIKDAQGQIDPEDLVTAWNIDDLKELREFIAYKVKKRKQEAEQNAIRMQQENTKSQIESAQAAEAAKRETLQFESDLKIKEINITKEWDYKIAALKEQNKREMGAENNQVALTKQAMGDDTKAEMQMGGSLAGEEGLDDEFQDLPEEEPGLEEALMQDEMAANAEQMPME